MKRSADVQLDGVADAAPPQKKLDSTCSTFSSAAALRDACRKGIFTSPTAGHASGCLQTNMVILPREHAGDFKTFCSNNAAPCPLLEVTAPGQFEASKLAPGSDLRTDLPKYHVWR